MTADRLTVAEIARNIDMSKPALVRYLAILENRVAFHADGQPPTYPAESLPLFVRLAEFHAAGAVTPKTMAAQLSRIVPDSEFRIPQSESNQSLLLSLPESQSIFLLTQIRDILLLSSYNYDLLTLAEAAAYLKCAPGSVSRRVKPFSRGIYRMSDIQAFIRTGRRRGG